MNGRTLAVRLLVMILPEAARPRYAEQWAADLRDADEVGLPQHQIVFAAVLVALALRVRLVRPVPLLLAAIVVAALGACLQGAATIALNTGDGERTSTMGFAVLLIALVVLAALDRTAAWRAAVVVGVLLIAEGCAVVWLGHMGWLEIAPGIGLLFAGLIGSFRVDRASVGMRSVRVLRTAALASGAALLLAGLVGIAGQYLDYRLNSGGFDCLEGFAGAPDRSPDAPASSAEVRTGFSWIPIGLTCSWDAGLPAAIAGRTTTATTNHHTTAATSDWITWTTFAGAGMLAVVGGVTIGAGRRMRSRGTL